MMHRRRALMLVILAAIPVIAAAQLNPTVKVLTRPKAAVPAECDEGLAIQPVQRLTTEERTSVRDSSRDMLAPPTASLRSSLEAAVIAAQHSSRQAFRDALTQSKSLLTSYPPGGERTAASNLVEVLDDVDRIWEYQFTSPTGAFFDASSEPFRIASKYPGYDSAIRRQIVTDQNGNRFYPTHETRDFLIAESGQRLPRVTGKPAPRPVSSSRGTTTTIARPPAPRATVTTIAPSSETTTRPKPHHTTEQTTTETNTRTTTRTTTHTTRPSHRRATHKPVVQEARAKPAAARATPAHTTPAHTPPPKRSPAAVVRETTPSSATELAPTRPPVVSDTGTTPPPMTSTASNALTASTETALAAPATTATATETTATNVTAAPTESNPAEKPAPSRSLLGPILLIIVGVGLLLTLWRASS